MFAEITAEQLTIGTISRIRAALVLVPSLIRRPTRRVAERFRQIREEIAFTLAVNAVALGLAEDELSNLKEKR